jgi:drug/metabolite transporter (DMT)-like permease
MLRSFYAMTLETRSTLLLIFITLIWGSTIPMIKGLVDHVPPMTFVAVRFLLAAVINAILMAVVFRRRLSFSRGEWNAGFTLGLFLFIGYCAQAIGMQSTTATNAGFITGLPVVIVPLIYRLQGRPIPMFSWIGVGLSLVGVACLTLTSDMSVNPGDLWILLCAVAFAFQIINIGSYSTNYSPVNLTLLQLIVCGLLSGIFALVFENPIGTTIIVSDSAWLAFLFCTVLGTSFAYIIQTLVQKHTSAPRAALIFSFEPIFAVVFAFLLLGEVMSTRTWIGGALMTIALFVADFGPWLFRKRGMNHVTEL